jgi:addiction module HigA family antidote
MTPRRTSIRGIRVPLLISAPTISPYRTANGGVGEMMSNPSHMPATRVSEILREKRGITADTAMRLSRYFGNSANFWLGLQAEYDLREAGRRSKKEFDLIQPIRREAIVYNRKRG